MMMTKIIKVAAIFRIARSSSSYANAPNRMLFSSFHNAASSTTLNRERTASSPLPTTYLDYSGVKQASDAISFFNRMLTMKPCPNVVQFTMLLNLVCKMEDYSLALHMFDKMRHLALPFNEYTLTVVINCYSLLNRVDLGFSIFGLFIKSGLVPNVITFSTFVNGLMLDNKGVDAVLLYKKLAREKLCEPNEVILTTLMHCYSLLNRVDIGFSVFGIFLKSGLVPNEITFNTLIKGLFLDDKGADAVLLFKKLSRENLCEIDEVIFCTVIDGLCKFGNGHVAVCLLGVLVKGSCKLNVHCYSPIIDRFCKDGRVDDALQLFSKMDVMGVMPNVVIYNSILQGLCDFSRWKEARDLLNMMISRGVLPNLFTYSILIHGFCQERKMKKANSVLAVMMRRNVAPNIVTYSALIDGYCLHGKIEKARQVFDLVSDFGLQPNIATYSTMLHGLCKHGLLQEAMDIFARMEKYGPHPNVTTFSTMIGGLCEDGLVKEAKRMLVEMEKCGCVPDPITYYVIVKGCLEINQLQEAQPLLEDMKGSCLSLEATNLHMLLDYCIENGGDGVPLDMIKKLFELN